MDSQVEEVALQSCRFMRWDGAKVYYPTYVLARTPFINMSRSGFKWESFIVSPFSICLTVAGILKSCQQFCKDYLAPCTGLIQRKCVHKAEPFFCLSTGFVIGIKQRFLAFQIESQAKF